MIPDAMLRYATDELVGLLRQLSQPQIDAIHAVVRSGHLSSNPPVPFRMLSGPSAIVSERTYYRQGKLDATGTWIVRPGWKHQTTFLAALDLAKRLALAQAEHEELSAVRKARRAARMASERIIDNLVSIATDTSTRLSPDGLVEEVPRGVEHRDQIAAAGAVLKHAGLDAADAQLVDTSEQDWWQAAEET